MAIVKVTTSGKGVLFIDDDGNTFVTSLFFLRQLLDNKLHPPFILLSKMPYKVNDARFKKSEVWTPPNAEDMSQVVSEDNLKTDALSKDFAVAKALKKEFQDKKVW